MPTTTTKPAITTAPTWSAYEVLPDGRERQLVAHLTYTKVLAAHFDDAVWAVVWRQDPRGITANGCTCSCLDCRDGRHGGCQYGCR